MSDTLALIHGTATDAWVDGNKALKSTFYDKVRADFRLALGGAIGLHDLDVGGADDGIAHSGEATGNFEVWRAVRVEIDNTSNLLSGFTDGYGAVLAVKFRYRIRVSNAGITVTPRIYNETDAVAATITGQVPTSGTATDFSGTNQQQTVYLTLATGKKTYVPQFTIGGTPGTDYLVYVHVFHDRMIQV